MSHFPDEEAKVERSGGDVTDLWVVGDEPGLQLTSGCLLGGVHPQAHGCISWTVLAGQRDSQSQSFCFRPKQVPSLAQIYP